MDTENTSTGTIKFSGQDVSFDLAVCPDVDCDCGFLSLGFMFSENAMPFELELDVYEREVNSDLMGEDENLDDAIRQFSDSLTEKDWNLFFDYYWYEKAKQSLAAPLDAHPYAFDFSDIEKGDLIGYAEVFPFADDWTVTFGGRQFTITDYYCLNSSCGCHDVMVEFSEDRQEDDDEIIGAFSVDYRNQIWSFSPENAPQPGALPMPVLKTLAENEIPDFYRKLEEQHKKLRQLYQLRRSQQLHGKSKKNKKNKR